MRLNSLHLVNFRQHVDTRVDFDLGLTGIIGPNGAGKTTILEAIAWALYGQAAARGTRETLRHLRAGPRAPVRVELEFELAGHRYRVARGLTSAELYLDGAEQPIANSISGVSDLLQRRLGMTRSEFFNTYFTGQKELNVMAAMGPSERAQFLSRVLGYDKLRTAQTLVRDRRKELTAQLTGLRQAMPDPDAVARMLDESRGRLAEADVQVRQAEEKRRDAEAAFAVITPRWQSAQHAREALQTLLAELRVAESEAQARERDRERIEKDLAGVAEAKLELEQLAAELAPLVELGAEFRAQDELAREEGRRRTLANEAQALGDEIERLRARRERMTRAPQQEESVTLALEQKRREMEAALGELEARRTEWVRDRQEAETKRDQLRRQYAELKTQRDRILDLGEDGECPTCTRPLGASFRTVLDQLEEQLETIAVDGRYYTTRLEQLKDMPPEIQRLDDRRRAVQGDVGALERQLAQVQSEVLQLSQLTRDVGTKEQRFSAIRAELDAIPTGYDVDRHALLRREIDRLGPLNERATRLSAQIEREGTLRQESQRVTAELATLAGRLADMQARREATEFSEGDYQRLREEFEAASALARVGEVALVTARAEQATARAAMETAERARAELERSQDTLRALQREKRLHEELDRAYTDLRTDLNFQLRPELSDIASSFVAALTDGRYSELELDDQYNIIVLEEGTPKPVISGGEEDLSNLVLRLAISQMIAERAGQAFSLLVLDEVFGSLDEARRHNVIDLLRRLQDRFEQVILITHIESVREGLDRVIAVDYDEQAGASRVRQVEPGAIPGELLDAALEGAGADER